MIAVHGSLVAHLGGWRGDRLSLSRGGGAFATLTDLGWDRAEQTTPQRRLLLTADALFVLEPAEGPFLAPPLRVRRFDLDGRETGREEDEGVEGEAALFFRAEAAGVERYGVDPQSGRAVRWKGEWPTRRLRPGRQVCGVPLRAPDGWWYPLGEAGLVRAGVDGATAWRGEAGPGALVGGEAVFPGSVRGRAGVWMAGRWHPLPGPRLFPRGRFPLVCVLAPVGERGLVCLRREGGDLPVLGAPPAHLPSGAYSGLAALPDGLFGVTETDPPRMVPVGL